MVRRVAVEDEIRARRQGIEEGTKQLSAAVFVIQVQVAGVLKHVKTGVLTQLLEAQYNPRS